MGPAIHSTYSNTVRTLACIGNGNKDRRQADRRSGRIGDILCSFKREKTTTSKRVADPFASNGTGRQLLDVDFSLAIS